jgi:hypothetical protein
LDAFCIIPYARTSAGLLYESCADVVAGVYSPGVDSNPVLGKPVLGVSIPTDNQSYDLSASHPKHPGFACRHVQSRPCHALLTCRSELARGSRWRLPSALPRGTQQPPPAAACTARHPHAPQNAARAKLVQHGRTKRVANCERANYGACLERTPACVRRFQVRKHVLCGV